MLIPFNVTQGITDLLVSSSSSILVDRAERCDTIGHCRTVWNIIWSCLITIFACIWVAVHPNIPQPKPPPKSRFGILADMCRGLGEKLMIALLALLAPEFIFVWALRQWLRARSIAKECREATVANVARERSARVRDWRKERHAAEKDLVRAQLRAELENLEALGRGKRTEEQGERLDILRNRSHVTGKESEERSTIEDGADKPKWTTAHGFFILMGGFHQFDGDQPGVYLLPDDVVSLVSAGILTPPSEEQIKDRSKSDSFSKLIVLVQTLWFVMQCIARHIEHLTITELEVATLAYTVPILGIYICWWNKPLGVTQPIRIPKSVWDVEISSTPPSLWDRFGRSFTGFEVARDQARVPRFSAGGPTTVQIAQADIVTSIITILFGAIHCFAWSFHFPSESERLLWRIASLITTASPVFWGATFVSLLMTDSEHFLTSFLLLLTFISIPLYLVARAILLVLAFIGLRLLPPAVYETVYWTTLIPHV